MPCTTLHKFSVLRKILLKFISCNKNELWNIHKFRQAINFLWHQYNDDEENEHLNIATNVYFSSFFIMTGRIVKTTGVRIEICLTEANNFQQRQNDRHKCKINNRLKLPKIWK